MKAFLLVLAVLPTVILSGPAPQNYDISEDNGENMDHFLVETSPGVYRVEDLVNVELDTRASETDLTYHFFNERDPHNGVDIKTTDIDALRNTRFSRSKDTVFIIHGWISNNETSLNYHIRLALLAHHDINVFVVDWSPIARRNYLSAKNSVVKLGEHIADFVRSLVSRYRLRLSRVAFIGHSLGAQISGNAGAALNGEVDHIVGLDPAGPLFSVRNIDERLDPTDAKFVQVIHTNGGALGFKAPCGDADYYPNGGSSQPGCGMDVAGICAHERSNELYAESVLAKTSQFVSEECTSYRDYSRGRCSDNSKSAMGGYTVDTRARGDHYLDTNRRSPFALG